MYRPHDMNVPMMLLIPQKTYLQGVIVKTWDGGQLFFGSFKTYGGSESVVNGIYSNVTTATIDTWYRPDIKSDCRIKLLDDATVWEIVSEPENIERRNQFLQFKVKKVTGGA